MFGRGKISDFEERKMQNLTQRETGETERDRQIGWHI